MRVAFQRMRDLLARIDQRKLGAAERARGGMEVDVVRHRVGVGIDQRHFDVIALVNHHQRARHRAVEGHGLECGSLVVDDDLLFLDLERELHDLWTFLRRLLVRMHEGRGDQVDMLSRQLQIVSNRRCRDQEGGNGCAKQQIASVHHDLCPASSLFDVTSSPETAIGLLR